MQVELYPNLITFTFYLVNQNIFFNAKDNCISNIGPGVIRHGCGTEVRTQLRVEGKKDI